MNLPTYIYSINTKNCFNIIRYILKRLKHCVQMFSLRHLYVFMANTRDQKFLCICYILYIAVSSFPIMYKYFFARKSGRKCFRSLKKLQ